MTGAHPAHELAAFQRGERRFVLAVDLDGSLVPFPVDLLDESQDAFRARARDRLRCVVPMCRAPLQAHFRKTKRPGYAHASGTARVCSGESLWHEMGKLEFARWVESKYAEWLTAVLEMESNDRSRRPDVTIISNSTDRRIAVEVQYSGMTVREWRARYADHIADGFTADIWLLGHVGANRPSETRAGAFKLNALAAEIASEGLVPLWINTGARTVLTAWSEGDQFGPLPVQANRALEFEIISLDECALDADGLVTPAINRIRRARVAREEAARAAALAEAERRASQLEAARVLSEARGQRAVRWDQSPEHEWLIARHHEHAPACITVTSPEDQAVGDVLDLAPEHWKTIVYRSMAEATGQILTWKQVCTALARQQHRGMEEGHWATLRAFRYQVERDRLTAGTWVGSEFVSFEIQQERRSRQAGRVAEPPRPIDPPQPEEASARTGRAQSGPLVGIARERPASAHVVAEVSTQVQAPEPAGGGRSSGSSGETAESPSGRRGLADSAPDPMRGRFFRRLFRRR